MRSSSPSATTIRLTGSFPATALIDLSAFNCDICGPLELVAPRPINTFLNGACSTRRPSNGGATHTSGCVTGIVSYIQYINTVRGCPSSHFAYTTGLPCVPYSVVPTSYTRDSWQPSS